MSKFITPVSMEVTDEQYKKDLKEKLLNLGYRVSSTIPKSYPILVNNYHGYIRDSNSTNVENKKDYNRYYIDHYNPELFIALAAMTEGKDWIVGEYLVFKQANFIFQCSMIHGANHVLGWADNEFKDIFRKATKEEIINHFNSSTVQNKELKIGVKEDLYKIGDWIISPNASEPCADQIISINSKYYVTSENKYNSSILGFNKLCDTLRLATQDEIERSPYYISNKNNKGALKGFPSEIVEKMLERQVEQGNERNVSVFEENPEYAHSAGGFTWSNTRERQEFWFRVIIDKEFDFFFEKYPKKGSIDFFFDTKTINSNNINQNSFIGQVKIESTEIPEFVNPTFFKSKIIKN